MGNNIYTRSRLSSLIFLARWTLECEGLIYRGCLREYTMKREFVEMTDRHQLMKRRLLNSFILLGLKGAMNLIYRWEDVIVFLKNFTYIYHFKNICESIHSSRDGPCHQPPRYCRSSKARNRREGPVQLIDHVKPMWSNGLITLDQHGSLDWSHETDRLCAAAPERDFLETSKQIIRGNAIVQISTRMHTYMMGKICYSTSKKCVIS